MSPITTKILGLLAVSTAGMAAIVLFLLSVPVMFAKVLGIGLLFLVMILGGAFGAAAPPQREKRKA